MRIFKCKKNYKIINKKSCFIESTVEIGEDVVIYENNRIYGKTKIADGTILLPNNYICDCEIGENCEIENSHLEGAEIGDNVKIGPFARIRPKTKIAENCKIGNFVEIKNSEIGKGCKISHLAYVGDVEMGERCNVGCGVVFVNYNGKEKNKTIVGSNCFIGSNANIIAPCEIKNNCYICAGTTITHNLDEYDFAIGRVREEVKPRRAINYLKNIY